MRKVLNLNQQEADLLVYVCGFYLGKRHESLTPQATTEWIHLLGKLGVQNPEQYFG